MAKLGHYICIFITICHMFSYDHVDGRPISSYKTLEHTRALKTIRNKIGDIIDCVDIYKQPAFNHPLLSNHTIQMKPSSYPKGMEVKTLEPKLLQDWNEDEKCPKGTIPIVRSPQHILGKHDDDAKQHEYAVVYVDDGNYFGASARLNIWQPTSFDDEFSLAQIIIRAGPGQDADSLRAGWKTGSGTNYTRLFVSWTSHGGAGCYDYDCPGFVQVSHKLGPTAVINHVSRYAGDQMEMPIYIFKDKKSGNWWLKVHEIDIGYWPSSIFKKLSDRGDTILWGGEIVNSGYQGRHTSTQMGSGHFPSEGYRKASYIRNIMYLDKSRSMHDVGHSSPFLTRPKCYGLKMGDLTNYGTHFFYGGPGYSNQCRY